jgi:CheY-like chemotaxis protein
MPPDQRRRRARVRAEHSREYPVSYAGQWLRVIEGHDPDVPLPPDHIRVEAEDGVRSVPAAHFEIAERGKRLILVVDDDPGIRRTLEIALTKAGYDVVQAGDGDEATRLWHETGPDLIVTDIHMPRKSGLLLIEDIRAQRSSIPIIAMTDGGPASNLGLLSVAKLLGSVRTIAKPYSLEEMVKTVDEAVGR